MFANKSTATPSTLVHHAADALVYGRWSEATRLFAKAAERIEAETIPDHRMTILAACADFDLHTETIQALHARLETATGRTLDVLLLAELVADVASLAESAGESESWADWLNEEIDHTLADMLTTKENHHV